MGKNSVLKFVFKSNVLTEVCALSEVKKGGYICVGTVFCCRGRDFESFVFRKGVFRAFIGKDFFLILPYSRGSNPYQLLIMIL